MYIQHRRNGSKFMDCNSFQNCIGLISLKPPIGYYFYTERSKVLNMGIVLKSMLQDLISQSFSINKMSILDFL